MASIFTLFLETKSSALPRRNPARSSREFYCFAVPLCCAPLRGLLLIVLCYLVSSPWLQFTMQLWLGEEAGVEVAALALLVQSMPLEIATELPSEFMGFERLIPWMRRINCFTFSNELCMSFCFARMVFFMSIHF